MTKINKSIIAIVILLFLININSSIIFIGRAQEDPIVYNWEETTYSNILTRIWDNESRYLNHNGSFFDSYNHTLSYIGADGNWIEEERIITYESNYTLFVNNTITGNLTYNINMDVYKVNVTKGTDLEMIWFALKKANFVIESIVDQFDHGYNYENNYLKRCESTYTKYDRITNATLGTWNDTFEESGTYTYGSDMIGERYLKYFCYETEFTMPLFLIIQIYTTPDDRKVAWAELFSDFIVYNDTDKNGIYSVGDINNAPVTGFVLPMSNEFKGFFLPKAESTNGYVEFYDPVFPDNYTWSREYPGDTSIDEITSWIDFTPPTQSVDDEITWNIEYPDYPIWATGMYSAGDNASYSTTSPSNFSYRFDYNINETQADLDFALEMPKISNSSFYDAVHGLSLSMPHYTFLLSSAAINAVTPYVLTAKKDKFAFDLNGTIVAEINMVDMKEYYDLYDYPDEGNQTRCKTMGSSVDMMLSSPNDYIQDPSSIIFDVNPFKNLVFMMQDMVEGRHGFEDSYRFYSTALQNYPVWSGEKLFHDPTLIAYIGGAPVRTPDGGGPDMFLLIALIGAGVIVGSGIIVGVVVFFMRKRKLA